jgi:low affinity Fe/Cu permease
MKKLLVVAVLVAIALAPTQAQQDVRKIQDVLAEILAAFEARAELPTLPANKPEDLRAGRVRIVLEAARASDVREIESRVAALGGRVEAVYQNLVQAFVPMKAVSALAGL